MDIAHINPENFQYAPLDADAANQRDQIVCWMDPVFYEKEYQVRWFVGLNFQKEQVPAGQSINLTDDIQRFTDVVHQQSKQSGLYKNHMTIKCEYANG